MTRRTTTPADPQTWLSNAAWRRRIRVSLAKWYRTHARDLPWRHTRDPYRIWISEVMLQQTQVVTVIPYYERFMAAFPTVETLAQADEHRVLRLWEGLGYYRRARQLHRAAQLIVQEHAGQFPESTAVVRRLPGIGRYTAGAILSIAFDAREPILEANTIRLLSRLIGYTGDPRSKAGQDLLWQAATVLLPQQETGRFNQALMELGSLICSPRHPLCGQCPVAASCATNHVGWQDRIPVAPRKTIYEEVREVAVVVWNGDRVFVRRCAEGERWAGLWDFPRFATGHHDDMPFSPQMIQQAESQVQLRIDVPQPWFSLKHGVTRFKIHLSVFQSRTTRQTKLARSDDANHSDRRWLPLSALSDLPLSTTGRKIAQRLAKEIRNDHLDAAD